MTKSEIITKILPAVVLAPSAHNTQPWQFALGEDWLDVVVDESRHLAVSDPTRRQLYVSLGCVITNAVVAAASGGYLTRIDYSPGPVAAQLHFTSGTPNQHLAALYPAISTRRTNRNMYDGQPLTSDEHSWLKATYDSGVHLVEDKGAIEQIAKCSEAATLATLGRADFKGELSHWVRNSWTKQPDGMPGYAMGIPAVLSLLAPVMVKIAPIHKEEGPKVYQQTVSASVVAVITTPGDTIADWLRAGQLLEQVWLEAVSAGLAAAPLASAIESSEETRRGVQEVLKTDGYPQAIIRLGHSDKHNLRASPRRSVGDCLR